MPLSTHEFRGVLVNSPGNLTKCWIRVGGGGGVVVTRNGLTFYLEGGYGQGLTILLVVLCSTLR